MNCMNPEQSQPAVVDPPQTYGTPRYCRPKSTSCWPMLRDVRAGAGAGAGAGRCAAAAAASRSRAACSSAALRAASWRARSASSRSRASFARRSASARSAAARSAAARSSTIFWFAARVSLAFWALSTASFASAMADWFPDFSASARFALTLARDAFASCAFFCASSAASWKRSALAPATSAAAAASGVRRGQLRYLRGVALRVLLRFRVGVRAP